MHFDVIRWYESCTSQHLYINNGSNGILASFSSCFGFTAHIFAVFIHQSHQPACQLQQTAVFSEKALINPL